MQSELLKAPVSQKKSTISVLSTLELEQSGTQKNDALISDTQSMSERSTRSKQYN